MVRTPSLLTIGVSFLLIGAQVTASAQTVESPVYLSWARVPVGTQVVQKSVTTAADGNQIESKTIQKLKSIDEATAVIEQTYIDPTGEEFVQVFRERRRVPLLPGVDPQKVGRPRDAKAKGEEMIELAGRSFKAEWYDTTGQAEAGTMLVRTWFSDEVPGLILKVVTQIENRPGSTTIELVDLILP